MFDEATFGVAVYADAVLGTIASGVTKDITTTLWMNQCEAQTSWFNQFEVITTTEECK